MFQTRMVLSADPLARRSGTSGSVARELTMPVWPISVRNVSPDWVFHRRIVWSSDPLASKPLDSTVNVLTPNACPWSVRTRRQWIAKNLPLPASQILMVLSIEPLASSPDGRATRHRTDSVWPRRTWVGSPLPVTFQTRIVLSEEPLASWPLRRTASERTGCLWLVRKGEPWYDTQLSFYIIDQLYSFCLDLNCNL